ncbi:hypothetical protein C8J56DRAFT_982632, partial [Mycena floridula]
MWKGETLADELFNRMQYEEDTQEHKHGKREQKLLSEKPRWESPAQDDVKPKAGGKKPKPDGPKSDGKKTSGKGEEAHWPLVARCVPYVHNKLSITCQSTALQGIVTIGRKKSIGNLLTGDPFCTSVDFKETMQKMFLKITKDSKQAEIRERLKKDPAYMSAVCSVVTGRISLERGNVKSTAIPVVVSHFRLTGIKVPDCQIKVASLCNENLFHYGVTEDGKVIDHQPFLNPVILEVLVLTWGKPFIMRTYDKLFMSSFPDDPVKKEERELPAGMVALAATAVVSVLRDWRGGSRPMAYSDFDADNNVADFNTLFDTLNNIKTENRACYH